MKIEDLSLIKRIFEAALLAAEKPMMRRDLVALFDDLEAPTDELIDQAITELGTDCEGRGYELTRVASGYRFQVRQDLSRWVSKLWQERTPRYSRALLETLSLVAYRQPITRGEIEEIRGVAVSSNIIKTLLEREWVKVVGHRDVPGRPAIYATTRPFLDYFNLKSLDQLPPLADVRELSTIGKELNIELPEELLGPANDDAQSTADDGETVENSQPVENSQIVDGDERAIDGSVADETAELEEGASADVQAVEEAQRDNVVTLHNDENGHQETAIANDDGSEGDASIEPVADEVAAFETWIDSELVDNAEGDTVFDTTAADDVSADREPTRSDESAMDDAERQPDSALEMQASPPSDDSGPLSFQ